VQGKDLQSLIDLRREQGHLTFEQVSDLLPQDVPSPSNLRAALESFGDTKIKVLEGVPAESTQGELEVEPEKVAEEDDALLHEEEGRSAVTTGTR